MKRLLHTTFALTLAASWSAAGAQSTHAQSAYPTKPIRMVIPFPPGGTTDIQGRMIADKLVQRLGQPVVVDNRGGAQGMIGMEVVARAPADGYTLVVAVVGPWAVNPHLYKLPYDVFRDFAPLVHVAHTPGVLVVHPSLAAKTVKELVDLARQKPGELNYASAGVGGYFHIAAELFLSLTATKMTHVPYKGPAAALTDLIGGRVHVMFNTTQVILPHITSGKVRALATTGARRIAILPNLPTVAEAGVPGYESSSWTAIGLPARTPRLLIDLLNREVNAILKLPDIQERFAAGGAVITGGTPEEFRRHLESEHAKYGKLLRAAGIKPELLN